MMTNVEVRYFDWLYGQIGTLTDRNPLHSHWLLAEQLANKEFKWFIPNDDNREADGKQLRVIYSQTMEPFDHEAVFDEPCSMLEMFIALAARVNYEAQGLGIADSTFEWFWLFMDNLGLRIYTDEAYLNFGHDIEKHVDKTVNAFLERRYGRDGVGGLFPLKRATNDQRKTELWYQASAYLLENSDIGD